MKYKLFLVLIIVLISLQIVNAKEYVGISLDCYSNCNEEVHYENDLILTLTISNNLDYWISIGKEEQWGGADLYINSENKNLDNGKGSRLYNDFIGQVYYIPPKDKLEVYLPYDIYNELDKEKRLGEWILTPEMHINNPKFYESNPFSIEEKSLYEGSKSYTLSSTIKGNELRFAVIKPEIEIESWINKFKALSNSWKIFLSILGIIILITGAILGIAGVYKLFK